MKTQKKKIIPSNMTQGSFCCERHLRPPQVVIKNRKLVTVDAGEELVVDAKFEGVQCYVLLAESVKTLMKEHRVAGVFYDAHDPKRAQLRQEIIMHLYAAETKFRLDSIANLNAARHLGSMCYELENEFRHRVEVLMQSILFLLSR